MLGNFTFYNPTKIYFGKDALDNLKDELKNYGDVVCLIYGGGSIKKTGLYDKVMAILKEANKTVVEDAGVMPNPTVDKLYEGIKIARDSKVSLLLAVGGGSVIDYAKAVSVSIHSKEDSWQKYYLDFKDVDNEIVPVGSILTMAGTGSEANGGAVITNPHQKLKIGHVFGPNVFPKFSILNPELTYTVPKYQMIAGIYDIMSHILEQYFSGDDDNTSDYVSEGLMKNLIKASLKAVKDPYDYEARSNIMWDATLALNTLVAMGKETDWMVHMLGQAVGAVTDATHGMTLSAVTKAYYEYIMPYGLHRFKRFAINVWNVDPTNKTDEQVAKDGLNEMLSWMKEIGLVMNLTDLGATLDMVDDIVKATALGGGYKKLNSDEVREIILASF